MLDDSAHGERLAWICLLCFAKAQGRAGRVRMRDKTFAQRYRLSVESVEAMMARAVTAGAVTVEGDTVTVVNWKLYQDPRVRSRGEENRRENEAEPPERRHFTKTSEKDATIHHPPPTKPPPTTKVFVRPTIDEVRAYCLERGKGVDPQRWLDHYESNGWKVGKVAMKDWKAAVRKWENNDYGQPAARVGAGQRFRG